MRAGFWILAILGCLMALNGAAAAEKEVTTCYAVGPDATPAEVRKQRRMQFLQAGTLLLQGQQQNDEALILQALASYRDLLSSLNAALNAPAWCVGVRAFVHEGIGLSLQVLGVRDDDMEKLAAAVAELNVAVQDARAPVVSGKSPDFSMRAEGLFQKQLGRAQVLLAEQELLDAATEARAVAHLHEAVETFEQAAQKLVRVPGKSDLEIWAELLSGVEMSVLLLDDKADTSVRQRAADAQRAFLRVVLPAADRRSRRLRGSVLLSLGSENCDKAQLAAAAASFQSALLPDIRQNESLEWATDQEGLGDALALWGECSDDAHKLKLARSAYRAALKVYVAKGAEEAAGRVKEVLALLSEELSLDGAAAKTKEKRAKPGMYRRGCGY